MRARTGQALLDMGSKSLPWPYHAIDISYNDIASCLSACIFTYVYICVYITDPSNLAATCHRFRQNLVWLTFWLASAAEQPLGKRLESTEPTCCVESSMASLTPFAVQEPNNALQLRDHQLRDFNWPDQPGCMGGSTYQRSCAPSHQMSSQVKSNPCAIESSARCSQSANGPTQHNNTCSQNILLAASPCPLTSNY